MAGWGSHGSLAGEGKKRWKYSRKSGEPPTVGFKLTDIRSIPIPRKTVAKPSLGRGCYDIKMLVGPLDS